MDLQRGITGIHGRKDSLPPPPYSDLKAFRSHCHLAARTLSATVLSIRDPGDEGRVRNYTMACVEFADCTVAILLNVVHPIIAFAKKPRESQIVLEYVDCPKLAEIFRTLGEYAIADSEEMNRPLVRDLCKDLAPAEQKRVRYFRPARVGDVIFNYWD